MTRATRGHTGRDLSADRITSLIYILVTLPWRPARTMSLARLGSEQRRGPDARYLLTPRLRLVHEGFDTADPKSAEAFVRELT